MLEEARDAGIEDFVFITGRHKELLEEHFDHQPELARTLEERNKTDLLEKMKGHHAEGARILHANPKRWGWGTLFGVRES